MWCLHSRLTPITWIWALQPWLVTSLRAIVHAVWLEGGCGGGAGFICQSWCVNPFLLDLISQLRNSETTLHCVRCAEFFVWLMSHRTTSMGRVCDLYSSQRPEGWSNWIGIFHIWTAVAEPAGCDQQLCTNQKEAICHMLFVCHSQVGRITT